MRILTAILLSSAAFAAEYTIDPSHSGASFGVRHMMVSTVRGHFSKVTGKVAYDPNNLAASKVEASVDVSTIDTREPKRDAHLKSPDFFDVANFPKITFTATKISGTPAELTIVGDLTIRGVTKSVTLTGELSSPMKDPWGMQRCSLEISGKIKRSEFGLTWNQALEMGGVLVSDEVKLTVSAQAVAAVPAAA